MTKNTDDSEKAEKKSKLAGTAIVAGAAIGSAAIAAALLYVGKRKDAAEAKTPETPSGEPPETD